MTQMTSGTGGRMAAVSPDNTTVGIVGLGDMGAAIARSIVRTFPVIAFDLRQSGRQTGRVGSEACGLRASSSATSARSSSWSW